MRYTLYIFSLFVGLSTLNGQADARVELVNGSEISGSVDSIYADGSIAILLGANGQRIYVPKDELLRYDLHANYERPRSLWASRKIHNTTSIYLLPNEFTAGIAIDHTLHWRWRPRVHFGGGASLLSYRLSSVSNTLALFSSARAYAVDRRTSPYMDMRLGYGIAMPGEEAIEANGGAYLQLQLGYKFEGRSTIWHFYTGYHRQGADYQIRTGGESISDYEVTFHRLVGGISIGF